MIRKIPADNSFIAERVTCQVLSKGVAAVLGPRSLRNSQHIKSICDNSEIPYIETRGPGRGRSGRRRLDLIQRTLLQVLHLVRDQAPHSPSILTLLPLDKPLLTLSRGAMYHLLRCIRTVIKRVGRTFYK